MSETKQFRERVQAAYSKIDFAEFCRRAGFREDDYAQRMWQAWQQFSKYFAAFDNITLEKILGEPPTWDDQFDLRGTLDGRIITGVFAERTNFHQYRTSGIADNPNEYFRLVLKLDRGPVVTITPDSRLIHEMERDFLRIERSLT